MRRPRLLDLYCGAGGAAMGYYRAGFDVYGVDIMPQPHYPFRLRRGDALETLANEWRRFDAIHASPPCQRYSKAQTIRNYDHPDLVPATRAALVELGMPYVIENVLGAPLMRPVQLCGCMFRDLRTYRPRIFETSFDIRQPAHRPHIAPNAVLGRRPRAGEYMHVVGNFTGADEGRKAMGIPWMTRNELREAIPPAYTNAIGRMLYKSLVGGELHGRSESECA